MDLTPSMFLPMYRNVVRPHLIYGKKASSVFFCGEAQAFEKGFITSRSIYLATQLVSLLPSL